MYYSISANDQYDFRNQFPVNKALFKLTTKLVWQIQLRSDWLSFTTFQRWRPAYLNVIFDY